MTIDHSEDPVGLPSSATTITVQCFGCQKQHSITGNNPHTLTDQLYPLGWSRRRFGQNAEPWFCSVVCAMNSPAAIEAAQLWHEENDKKPLHLTKLNLLGHSPKPSSFALLRRYKRELIYVIGMVVILALTLVISAEWVNAITGYGGMAIAVACYALIMWWMTRKDKP